MLSCSSPIEVQAVTIDASSGTVEFMFLYFESLANSSFTLLIDFDYLSKQSVMFANLSNFTYTFSFNQSQFFGQYFTEAELAQSKAVYTIAMYLSIGGLVLFLLGLFSK